MTPGEVFCTLLSITAVGIATAVKVSTDNKRIDQAQTIAWGQPFPASKYWQGFAKGGRGLVN